MGGWSCSVELFILFLIAASTYIREIEDFMCTQIYEGTPGGVIRFMAIFLLVYGLRLGLETLGRAAQIFFLSLRFSDLPNRSPVPRCQDGAYPSYFEYIVS